MANRCTTGLGRYWPNQHQRADYRGFIEHHFIEHHFIEHHFGHAENKQTHFGRMILRTLVFAHLRNSPPNPGTSKASCGLGRVLLQSQTSISTHGCVPEAVYDVCGARGPLSNQRTEAVNASEPPTGLTAVHSCVDGPPPNVAHCRSGLRRRRWRVHWRCVHLRGRVLSHALKRPGRVR